MAITFFNAAINPADNGSLDDTAARAVTPPASMVTGDLVFLFAFVRSGSQSLDILQAGGQSWTAETLRQSGSSSSRIFWCRYNGTWSASPSVETPDKLGSGITVWMGVWRPTTGTNTWAVDVAETNNSYSAPVTPFDVTATGQTAIAASTVSIFPFLSMDGNTWAIQTGGFSNAGAAYYRNLQGSDMSLSVAYKIQTSAGATGNVTNRQATLGGDQGRWHAITFKEQSAGPVISSISDGVLHHGETGIHVLGVGFGASHTGSADVIVSPSNNVADAGAVAQSINSWSATDILLNALSLNTFAFFANLYGFVKDSSGNVSPAFVIQREALVSAAAVIKNLAGTAQASLTNVRWRMTATSINGTLVASANNGTTDGSGNFSTGNIVLTGTTPLNPNTPDDVWIAAAIDAGSQAASYATCVKVTPTYA